MQNSPLLSIRNTINFPYDKAVNPVPQGTTVFGYKVSEDVYKITFS